MLDCTPLHHGFALDMDTDLSNVDLCVEHIRLFLEKRGEEGHLFAVSLLAREALNNAMIHGNGLDPAKRVSFRFTARDGGYDLEVEDQGPGFDWRGFLDFDPERAFAPNGRGIALSRQLSFATLTYIPPGNAVVVTVTRNKSADEGEPV